ncbi:hypothetical protein AMTRI_Chr06g171310 [Amborella trichopoda]
MECGGVSEEEEKKSIVAGDATSSLSSPMAASPPKCRFSLFTHQLSPRYLSVISSLSLRLPHLQLPLFLSIGLDLRAMCKEDGTARNRTHGCPNTRGARTSALTNGEPARVPSRKDSPHEYPHARRARTSTPHEQGARTSALTHGEPARVPSRTECPHKRRARTSAFTHVEPARVPSRM